MTKRVAIIAAMPRELSSLVKGWRSETLPDNVHIYSNGSSVAVCAGMGAVRVARAVQAAVAMPVTTIISAGLAGACDPAVRVGDVVWAGEVIDADTKERFAAIGTGDVLVSSSSIVSVAEKAILRAAYDAAAVDMEAATVARMAETRGLRFKAIKAISDEANFEMDDLSRFVTEDGRFRETAFAMHAMVRPAMWGRVRRLAKNSSKAVAALTNALERELD